GGGARGPPRAAGGCPRGGAGERNEDAEGGRPAQGPGGDHHPRRDPARRLHGGTLGKTSDARRQTSGTTDAASLLLLSGWRLASDDWRLTMQEPTITTTIPNAIPGGGLGAARPAPAVRARPLEETHIDDLLRLVVEKGGSDLHL